MPAQSFICTVVSYQNESCLFAISFLHNSRENGGNIGSSLFDETLYLIGHHSIVLLNRFYSFTHHKAKILLGPPKFVL